MGQSPRSAQPTKPGFQRDNFPLAGHGTESHIDRRSMQPSGAPL